MNRRRFLHSLATGTAVASVLPSTKAKAASDNLGKVLPQAKLSPNGPTVTCLGLGGYHVHWPEESVAAATIEAALEEGIRFFDTAESYGPHTSEERYGKYLTPKYRDQIFLMTKSEAKDAASARAAIEGSLSRLKTDVIDLWQIHAIASPEDVDTRLDGGVLEEALKAKSEGKIRHIGFTGHASPYAHLRMLERTAQMEEPFLACQFPVNPVDAAAKHSFVVNVLPAAQKRGINVLAMKTLADGRFFGSKTMNDKVIWESKEPVVPNALSIAECIYFALSMPISVLITGAENPELVREKAELVRKFQNIPEETRKQLIEKVASYAESGRVEYYKAKDLRSGKA